MYDRIAAMWIPAYQRHDGRIVALEQANADLTAQVADLRQAVAALQAA